jgi:hypothetical protein
MIKLLLLLLVFVSTCVAIHGLGMVMGPRWIGNAWPGHGRQFGRWSMFGVLACFSPWSITR